jgi:hypothetical protein
MSYWTFFCPKLWKGISPLSESTAAKTCASWGDMPPVGSDSVRFQATRWLHSCEQELVVNFFCACYCWRWMLGTRRSLFDCGWIQIMGWGSISIHRHEFDRCICRQWSVWTILSFLVRDDCEQSLGPSCHECNWRIMLECYCDLYV